MKQKLCAILILIMLLLNSSLMTVISVAIEAVNNAADLTNEEVGEDTKVSNVDLKLNADYLVNNVENKVELTATLKTDDTKYSLFKNPTISIEMPSEIVDVVIGTPYLMYNNQIFTITKSEVVTNEVGNKVINVQLEGEQTEYETDSILEGTNIVIPASIVVSKQIDTMVSNIKLRYTNEIKCQTIYEANGEECEKQEINLINKIVRNLPAIASDEEAKTIEFEQDGIKVEIIEKVGNTVIPDNGTLYEQQIVKNVVKFTNNSTTAKPVNFTANIPDGLTYTEYVPQNILHNEEYDAYYISNNPSYKSDETKKQVNVNIEELGVGETQETYFELEVNDLIETTEKKITIDYQLIITDGQVGSYSVSNTIIEAEINATLKCFRLNGKNDWQYALLFTNITDRTLTNINVQCDIDKNFDITEIKRVIDSGEHADYDLNNVQDNIFVYSLESLEPGEQCYVAVDGITKDHYEDETNSYEMKGVYKVYGDEIYTYVSNETSVTAGIEKVKVTMTSDKDGQELKMDDEIKYTINIENIGNEKLAMSKYSQIKISDFIPEELEPISATFNNFIISTQYVSEIGNYLGAPLKVETYTEEQKELDLTSKIIPEGSTEEEVPNIDLNLSIPYGKTITIVAKAKVRMLTEKVDITNTVTVEGSGMTTKTASVTNTLLPYNYGEELLPEQPEQPDSGDIGGGTIVDPEEPEQPTEPEEPTEINVTGVELIPTETKLKVGQSTKLIANVVPNNATNKAINWSSSDESIAVAANGTVMAIKEGTAVITVTTEDGNKTATSTVIVEGNNRDDSTISVTGVQITPNSSTILVGGTVKLRAAVIPSNATNSKVTWSSSNQEVAIVSDNGLVTGVKEGRATITITTEDGNKTATCEIIVQNVNGGLSTPTNPEQPEEPTQPDNPTGPEQPTNPEEPTTPENPTTPEQPEEKMNVSGTAWIDTNENGKRDEGETLYSNMTVMLYNYETKKLVSINGIAIEKQTDESGRYEFTDLEKGKYIVIFWYDTTNYELTEYQKVGISNSENSDAVSKNVILQGEKKLAGLTDILTVEENAESIDIGLIENKEFDFSIQKYISKITIQTNKETKTYTYDNKNFAKVEVHSKQINGAQAIIEYKMVVKNEGELPGKVDLIVDEVPSDLNFYSELNSSWYKSKDGICTTALAGETIGVGETREVTIILTKNLNGNNVGTVVNSAKIAQTSNEKAIEEENIENNTAKAEVLITVSTGIMKWIGLVIGTLIVLGIIAFIAVKDKKLIKTISFMFIVGICIFGNATQVFADTYNVYVPALGKHLEMYCITPEYRMCHTDAHEATLIPGTEKITETLKYWISNGNAEYSLEDKTNKNNVTMTINGDKIRVGPFRVDAIKSSENNNEVKITSCNVTYIKVNGNSTNQEVMSVNNVVIGQDFYIEVPTDVLKIVKIDIETKCEGKTKGIYDVSYYGEYKIKALGTSSDHNPSADTGKYCTDSGATMQTLARSESEYNKEIEKDISVLKSLQIEGPWTAPGNLLVEKISYDDPKVTAKTYLPNVEIIITKGTNINDSKYLELYKSSTTKAVNLTIGDVIEFSNYTALLDESILPTVQINGINYTAKWTATKDNATKLKLTNGKVLIKNLRGLETYTVIETKNPNYGYESDLNKNITGSIAITKPVNSENVLSLYNGKNTGSLVIKKVDEDNNSIGLSGVQVVVKAKKNDQEMGYIKVITDESSGNFAEFVTGYCKIQDMALTYNKPITYVDTPEEATRFITGADGTVTIANLPATFVGANSTANENSEKWYYKVEEYANLKYGYAKEKYSEFGNVKYLADSAGTWAVNTNTGWKLLPTVYLSDSNNPTYEYGSSYKVTMTNKKLTGNIHIDKYDVEAGSGEKLENIGFVLKADLIENTENSNSEMFNMSGKYIKVKISHGTHSDDAEGFANYTKGKIRIADGGFVGSADSVIKFVDDPKDATIFYTNQDGEILIANILKSTNGSNYLRYKLEEYDSKTYGYVTGKNEESINSTVVFVENEVSTNSELPTREGTSPYLPEEYSYVEGDFDTGIVIQDSAGNQYVWVEVPKTLNIYQTAGLNITQFTDEEYKKIENDLHTYTSDYRRDGLVDEHFGNDNLTGMTQFHYNNQKKQMLKSIYQYGGFYVGRYETGIEDTWRTENTENTKPTSPTETPVIKANAYPYNTVTPAEAQSLAMSFATVGHTSSLMYGVQWDLMLKYIEQSGTKKELLTQSSYSWGNYYISSYTIDNINAKYFDETGEKAWKNGAYGNKDIRNMVKLSTGASNIFAKHNIYDIAGNVSELTLENKPIYGNDNKITSSAIAIRGGNYQCENDGINTYANTYYVKTDETDRDSTVGFRVALYKTEDINKEANIERVTKDGWVTPKRQKSTATRTNAVSESVSIDVKIGNFKQTGNLEINKIDSDDTNKKLESVKFVLQAQIEQGGEIVTKYVRATVDSNNVIVGKDEVTGKIYTAEVTGDCKITDIANSLNNTDKFSSLEFVDAASEATKFVTNSNGQIRILNLLVSTDGVNTILYRPVEVENLNYGYYEVNTLDTVEYESNNGWLEVERQQYRYTSSWDYIDIPEESTEVLETNPYLPAGFYYVEGTDLNTGLVIEDRLGNQYVWVEVPKTANIYKTAGLNITEFTEEELKKIENDLHTYTTVYRNGTSNVDEYSGNDKSTGLTKEQYYELKKKMLKSVYQNGGFYIGRYETGIADSYRTSAGETSEKPVIQEFAYPYTYVTNSQAQSLASSFTRNGYSTSLMFGVQWDLVLKYLETKGSTQDELNKNSIFWGNYFDSSYAIPNAMAKYSTNVGQTWSITSSYLQKDSGAHMLLSTGVSKKWFSKQNIYELAGNVGEWTLEYNTNNSKNPSIVRGSNMSPSGTSQASWRDSFSDTTNNAYIGFRVALYTNKELGSKFTTTTIKNKKYTTNIQINKVDIDSNKPLERTTFVIKATAYRQFADKYIRIIPDNGSNSYALKVTGSVRIADKIYTNDNKLSCVDFVDNIEDATHFITDENGQIEIYNLIMKGSLDFIQYTPIEVKNDHYGYVVDGSNETVRLDGYYIDYTKGPTKIAEQTRESGYSEAKFTFNRQSSTDTLSNTGVIKDENIITVKNIKQTGNLYINKGDYDQFENVKLEEVTFLVKAHLEGNTQIDGKYIKILPDGSTSYVDTVKGEVRVQDRVYDKETEQDKSPVLFVDKNSATKFVTNEQGKIIIMNLLMSSNGIDNIKYSFEEISNNNYGYVADGTNVTLRHKGQTLSTPLEEVQTAKYSIPVQPSTETNADASQENKEKNSINLRNIKQTGNIQINKVDFDDESNLKEKVTFAVRVDSNENTTINGKYIKIMVDPIYQANVETTDNDGYANIVNGIARVKDQCYNTTPFNASIKHVNNYEDATKFVTDSNGQIIIMNLMMSSTGKDKIEYIFEEIQNENYGYVAEAGQYNNYTLRYPEQDINTVKAVPQTLERQSSVETLNQPDLATQVTLRNIKQTGNLAIQKVDKDTGEKLANVEFVLKAKKDQDITHESNKYYGKIDGQYIKAETETLENGGIKLIGIEFVSDIEQATKFKTDANGSIKIYNLLMSTNGADKIMYQLVETKNQNYGYLTDTDKFADFKITYEGDKLNGDYVVIERQTNSETQGKGSENDTQLTVKNEQVYTRLSGMVWEDIMGGKSDEIDNQYTNSENPLEGDALIQGIEVFLYKDEKLVATTVTDKNGCYSFGTYKEDGNYGSSDYWGENAPKRDGDTLISNAENENGNIVISDLSRYRIEFIYDGLRYTTVKQGETENGATDVNNSKGKEDVEFRKMVDEEFTTIYGGTNDTKIINGGSSDGNKQTYELQYNANTPQNNQSQFIGHWTYSEYSLNEENRKFFTSNTDTGNYTVVANVNDIKWKPEYMKTDTIPYINQGLYRREQPDLAIESDIEKVEVIVDKYTNTYIYSGRELENEELGEETDGFGVEVKYGNKVGTSYSSRGLDVYTRPLYASDLAYNLTDSDNELMQVYVTYQIVVKNQSNTLTTKVNEIVNYFDSRYEIESINGATYDANTIEDVSEENQTIKYKKVKLILPEEKIEHNKIGTPITIKFKLNKDALIDIAHERATLYNVSEITSYSTFYGKGTLCAENKTANESQVVDKIYAGIDTDSAPGSANVVAEIEPAENGNNITKIKINGDEIEYDYSTPNVKLSDGSKATFEDDTGLAPSLVLGIDEKDPTRGLNGIVFEDDAIFEDCDNEEHKQTGVHPGEIRVGDGIYETGENLIKDAKVELYNVNKTQGDSQQGNATTRAKLYKLIIEGNMAHVETEDAITWSEEAMSDNSGKTYNYELMGVIPDEYLIRYSYGNLEETSGDGTKTSRITKIVKTDGTLKEVAAMDYKSTVLKSDTIIQALDIFNTPDRIKNLNWILAEEKDGENIIRYSDAADDLNLRNDQEDIYYGKHYELNTMTADTAVFEVGVEFKENADKINDAGEVVGKTTETKEIVLEDTNGDGSFGIGDKVVKVQGYSIVNPYQDFGIIERAKPDQYIEKTISQIKVVLQNGQELINGNPYEDDLSYVKALKMGTNPREDNEKLVNVELDNELVQGATLYLTYDITAHNNSELDYKYNKKDTTNPNSPDIPDTPGNRFYYFGEKGEGVEVQNAILKVVDYMDNELVLDEETVRREGKWEIINTKYLTGENPEGKIFISDEVKTSLGNNNYTILLTNEFEQLQPGEKATIQTHASKLLSIGDGDLEFVNHVEIIHTTGTRKVNNSTPGNYEPVQQNPNEQDDDNVKVVITPPTGLPLSKINQ